jgi:hypothetical protein
MTFFAITPQFLDESFSSSNSTEISMRRFYAQSFLTIGSYFQELSCKRTDTLTNSIVHSFFEYTKKDENRCLVCVCEERKKSRQIEKN